MFVVSLFCFRDEHREGEQGMSSGKLEHGAGNCEIRRREVPSHTDGTQGFRNTGSIDCQEPAPARVLPQVTIPHAPGRRRRQDEGSVLPLQLVGVQCQQIQLRQNLLQQPSVSAWSDPTGSGTTPRDGDDQLARIWSGREESLGSHLRLRSLQRLGQPYQSRWQETKPRGKGSSISSSLQNWSQILRRW